MDEKDVLVSGGLGFEKVLWTCDVGCDQAIVDTPIFLGGKDVVADGEVVGVAIDELEWKHGEAIHHTLVAICARYDLMVTVSSLRCHRYDVILNCGEAGVRDLTSVGAGRWRRRGMP
jgi:hypothetical protein